jgi:hypothetical protein
MPDLPKTLAASHWGHAYTLTDEAGGAGITWGRLLLGEWMDKADADALARQLAAGPDLLEACRSIASQMEGCEHGSIYLGRETLDALRAAILKATAS